MTVQELIRELGEYPPDAAVERYSDHYETGVDVAGVEFQAAQPERTLGGVQFGPDPARVLIR